MSKLLNHKKTLLLPAILLSLLILSIGCKKSIDYFNLPLAVNADTLHIDSVAGKTHIMIYAKGEWSAGFDEDVDWISIDKIEGKGNSDIVFSYSSNVSASRSVRLIITQGSLKQVIYILQAGKDPDIRFSQSKYTIPKQGMESALSFESNLTGAFKSVLIEYLYDDETMEKWITKDSFTEDGYKFTSLDNNSGRKRSVRVYFTVIGADDVEHTAFIDISQTTQPAFLSQKYSSKSILTKDPIVDTVILSGNVGTLFPSFTKSISYQQENNWIEDVTLKNDSLLLIAVRANNSGVVRNAEIHFNLTVNGLSLIDLTHYVTQSNSDFEEQDFSAIRGMISGSSGSIKINSPLGSLKGVVISDAGNANMETNNQTGFKTIDLNDTYKTAYIQSIDGKYGFRLKFNSTDDNTLERYSIVTVSINNLTLTKEENPVRYTISGLNAANIVEKESGSVSNMATKTMSINNLSDDDLYTFVTIKDATISIPYGSYMNVNRGYIIKADWNTMGTNPPYVDAVPTRIFDRSGESMNILVNATNSWSLTTLPQGSGTVSGIVTNSKILRYGVGGDIGKYQIRPVNLQDINLTGTPVATTLVEWNWMVNNGTATCAAGVINKDGSGNVLPFIGTGSLRNTTGATPTAGFNPVCHDDPNSKAVFNNGMQYTNVKWWDAANAKGEGFLVEFSTSGISAQSLLLNFSINGGSGSDATNHIPVYWEIEYSLNGTDYTPIPNTTFAVRPLVQYNMDRPFQALGLIPYTFKLPNSLQNKPNVILKIKAKSDICATGSPTGGEAGHITAAMPGTSMRLGNLSVKYIQ